MGQHHTYSCPGSLHHQVINWLGAGLTIMPVFWDIPRRPMITHTSDSHQIPSQNKTKLQIKKKKMPKIQILPETLHTTHLLKLLDKMYKYEMDPTRTVGATERTRDAGQTDGRTDGRSETNIPPNNFVVWGYNKVSVSLLSMSILSGECQMSVPF